MRRWTSAAPALRSSVTSCWLVVPRTIESSSTTRRASRMFSRKGFSLRRTPRSRWPWSGEMKVRPM